jgi:U4/U6.U5 tri-snRNP-associated protein 1
MVELREKKEKMKEQIRDKRDRGRKWERGAIDGQPGSHNVHTDSYSKKQPGGKRRVGGSELEDRRGDEIKRDCEGEREGEREGKSESERHTERDKERETDRERERKLGERDTAFL